MVLLLGGTLLVALHYWLGVGEGLDFAIGSVVYDAVVLGAGIACLGRASVFGRERSAWILIGLAILVWGAAEIYWTAFIEGNPDAPYPSPADIGYLLFYPLAYAGLGLLVRARAHEMSWRLWMDGAIAALGTAALGAAFVFDFVAGKAEGTPLQVATTLAYPLGDIAMVAMVVGVVALTGWRPGRTWSLLLAGLAALVVADIAYTLQSTGESLPEGNWIDPIYLVAAACLGAAVWQPVAAAEITAPDEGDRRRQMIVPPVFAAVMIGLFAMQYFSATSGLSTVLWAATMTAVILRLAMSDRENKALLEQVRTDPLTGLANRGRMQVDLPIWFGRASEERPARLLLLRPQRLQALQRQLRPPRRRRAADPAGGSAARRGRRGRGRLPGRRRRVLRPAHLRAAALRGGDPGRDERAQRGRARVRRQLLLGRRRRSTGGERAGGGAAARRRADVRAEGVPPPRGRAPPGARGR